MRAGFEAMEPPRRYYTPHKMRALPITDLGQGVVRSWPDGAREKACKIQSFSARGLTQGLLATRPLPQEYGLTVGGVQRYKRLTLLSYFAYLLIMLEATSA